MAHGFLALYNIKLGTFCDTILLEKKLVIGKQFFFRIIMDVAMSVGDNLDTILHHYLAKRMQTSSPKAPEFSPITSPGGPMMPGPMGSPMPSPRSSREVMDKVESAMGQVCIYYFYRVYKVLNRGKIFSAKVETLNS